ADARRTDHEELVAGLVAARDDALREATEHFRGRASALGRELDSLAIRCAPGAAGSSWRTWRPSEPDGPVPAPLLRIGAIQSERPLPALVPLLDRAHLWLAGDRAAAVDGLIAGVLLRALGCARPGDVRLTVYDPEHLGGSLAGFAPLVTADVLAFVGPGGLTAMLDEHVEVIRRINESVLAGEYASLAELTAAGAGPRAEPWRLLVLLGDAATAEELTGAQRAQLDRILRTGVACGVHVVGRGLPVADHPTVHRITVAAGGAAADAGTDTTVDGASASCAVTGPMPILLDPPPPAERVAAVCRGIADRVLAGPPPASFGDLEPEKLWADSSAGGLLAPLGDGPDGRLVEVMLGDDPPHALIAGPSGSGKTNLIYAWLAALCARYSPAELALYLLDFKEGVSFARFAPSPRDPSWLPQVRLVGVNVNSDREFGLALLRHLTDELRRRAQAAKACEATKLAELRAEDPGGHWPRVVAVIDEFQVLLAGRDQVAAEAVALLEDLARRGRSQGIHLVLASQDVSGIEALWGRSALVAQFTLRIALPKARRVLAETNLAADVIPRFHAVVNADSGVPTANRVVRLPDAGDRTAWRELQDKLWHTRPDGMPPPRLFDGETVPALPRREPGGAALGSFGAAPDDRQGGLALLGETIDVAARPAGVRLARAPGRNLAVLGTRVDEACAVLRAAGLSLADAHPVGTARFSVACLDADADAAARALHGQLPDAAWYDADTVADLLADALAEPHPETPADGPRDVPHYVLAYAWDAAADALSARPAGGGPTGHERLRHLLSRGPERRVHVLGWWRSVARLRDDLGGLGARFDPIGAWVALDVHGPDLAPLTPTPGGPNWYPRPRRALFFDRAVHRTPELIIPYAVGQP
ncbi:MAG TPA: FtsK/SpoIIIE domain-containing protein, partial [Pilimelia sp.]|nr:FtsK/SpoIIIE domain-containing protein [Pilimelia sp.]